MAEWRKIQTRFWDDPETLDSTPEDRLFWIYLLSNPLTKACGVYTLHPKQASMHTGYNLETITSLLARFISYGRILYNEETREVFIRKWFVYNSPNSPKILALIEKELEYVKTAEFKNAVLQAIGYSIDTVSRKTAVDVDVDVDIEEEKTSADEPRVDADSSGRPDRETPQKPKKAKRTFPPAWYRQAEEDYQRIKGVVLSGPEFGPLQRDLKLIFAAGHTPDDIRACAEWMESSPDAWTANWTVGTVRMKLAEFKAGKLNGNGRGTKNAASMLQQHDPSIYDRGRRGG